ncbi:hypothetical protein CBF29_01925 [Vagococcus elongatus]|uniref:Transposase n=1 Tax=Vagococcus elongatus TaxID=180344 RepID=A0A430B477_9ENTE|nr:hypothetical protein CBF29_01925 [Vagococcus elongatus]
MQVMVLPETISHRFRATNILEQLNEEARLLEKVIPIFSNYDSAIRILGALLIENDESWSSSPRKHLKFNLTDI